MEPEQHTGNTEYKSTLVASDYDKIDHVATQMRYRVEQGHGEATYMLGVDDDGTVLGLTQDALTASETILKLAAERVNVMVQHVVTTHAPGSNTLLVGQYAIRDKITHGDHVFVKVVMGGSVDSGKSTTASVLSTAVPDNGDGLARTMLCNHPHEIVSGRTSSVSQTLVCYHLDTGQHVPMKAGGKPQSMTWRECLSQAGRVVTLYDLPGHTKYTRTAVRSVQANSPDLGIVMIAANRGLLPITHEHIKLFDLSGVPIVFVISKVDMLSGDKRKAQIKHISRQIKKDYSRVCLPVRTDLDVAIAEKHVRTGSVAPIFHVSNTTMAGHELLLKFLGLVKRSSPLGAKTEKTRSVAVESVFRVPGVGTVIGGQFTGPKDSTISMGDTGYIGPFTPGKNAGVEWAKVRVRGIHVKRCPVDATGPGKYVCLAIKSDVPYVDLCSGLSMIFGNTRPPPSPDRCVTTLTLLATSAVASTIKVGYQCVMFSKNQKLTAKITSIHDKVLSQAQEVLRAGDTAKVGFRFVKNRRYRPHIKPGDRFVHRGSAVMGSGVVLSISGIKNETTPTPEQHEETKEDQEETPGDRGTVDLEEQRPRHV